MYNEVAPQNNIHKDFYILLLMGGCARIPCVFWGATTALLSIKKKNAHSSQRVPVVRTFFVSIIIPERLIK